MSPSSLSALSETNAITRTQDAPARNTFFPTESYLTIGEAEQCEVAGIEPN